MRVLCVTNYTSKAWVALTINGQGYSSTNEKRVKTSRNVLTNNVLIVDSAKKMNRNQQKNVALKKRIKIPQRQMALALSNRQRIGRLAYPRAW